MLMLHPQPAVVAPAGPPLPIPAASYRLSTEEADFDPADMRCWLTRGPKRRTCHCASDNLADLSRPGTDRAARRSHG